jgi:hypothetical protein
MKQNNNDSLPQHIVREIEQRNLSPRPKFYFLLKRSVFWFLAVLASLVGGIALAIIIFVFFDHDPEAAKYLHQNLIEDIMLSIPYLWILIFAAFIGVAKYGVRHTKAGYKYSTVKIISAVLFINILLGLTFDAFDMGSRIDDFLSDAVPYYSSLVYTSKDAWTNTDKGLLGGYVVSATSSTEFSLRDFKNKIWQVVVDPNEMDEIGKNNIVSGNMIKIVGVREGVATFQAKQIFSWDN